MLAGGGNIKDIIERLEGDKKLQRCWGGVDEIMVIGFLYDICIGVYDESMKKWAIFKKGSFIPPNVNNLSDNNREIHDKLRDIQCNEWRFIKYNGNDHYDRLVLKESRNDTPQSIKSIGSEYRRRNEADRSGSIVPPPNSSPVSMKQPRDVYHVNINNNDDDMLGILIDYIQLKSVRKDLERTQRLIKKIFLSK